MKKTNTIDVDLVRFIISILVIAIHTYPLQFISDGVDYTFTRVFCRICVPFFLMISGYFVVEKALDDKKVLIEHSKKMAIMYLISIAIYLPIQIYTGYFENFSFWLFIKDVLFDGFYFHLWYFPATIFGMWFIYFLIKHFNKMTLGLIVTILYLIGLFGDNYYRLSINSSFLKTFYDMVFSITYYTRNGLFYAPIFLYIGYVTKKYIKKADANLFWGIICLVFMLVEGTILRLLAWPRHTTMYIFLVPTCYFLFSYMMTRKTGSNKFLREASTWIYIMHPFMVTGVRFLGNLFHIEVIYKQSLLYFLLVTAITCTFATGLVYVKNKIRQNKCIM